MAKRMLTVWLVAICGAIERQLAEKQTTVLGQGQRGGLSAAPPPLPSQAKQVGKDMFQENKYPVDSERTALDSGSKKKVLSERLLAVAGSSKFLFSESVSRKADPIGRGVGHLIVNSYRITVRIVSGVKSEPSRGKQAVL
ncbi:hypothetical protein FISHEDRAFT_57044 [Fistulina hepatica ATCC 64428]|nr:hypothetical protein FISHEDRAFT_57044 [Fistulina hepatica ATCC 64428]